MYYITYGRLCFSIALLNGYNFVFWKIRKVLLFTCRWVIRFYVTETDVYKTWFEYVLPRLLIESPQEYTWERQGDWPDLKIQIIRFAKTKQTAIKLGLETIIKCVTYMFTCSEAYSFFYMSIQIHGSLRKDLRIKTESVLFDFNECSSLNNKFEFHLIWL